MKTSKEYIELSKDYAEKTLSRFKEKFGDNFVKCDDNFAIYLLRHGYMDGRISGEFDMYEMQNKIQKYLIFLTKSGWSELIDERFRDEVNESLRSAFPDITVDEITELGKIVFI